jgi:hypothetical protein
MVEHVNRSAQGQNNSWSARARRTARPTSRAETAAGHEFDLCVDVTKLALNCANCYVGRYLSLGKPHQLLWVFVLHACAVERERVAVAAIGVGLVVVQRWQQLRQLTASLL